MLEHLGVNASTSCDDLELRQRLLTCEKQEASSKSSIVAVGRSGEESSDLTSYLLENADYDADAKPCASVATEDAQPSILPASSSSIVAAPPLARDAESLASTSASNAPASLASPDMEVPQEDQNKNTARRPLKRRKRKLPKWEKKMKRVSQKNAALKIQVALLEAILSNKKAMQQNVSSVQTGDETSIDSSIRCEKSKEKEDHHEKTQGAAK